MGEAEKYTWVWKNVWKQVWVGIRVLVSKYVFVCHGLVCVPVWGIFLDFCRFHGSQGIA